MAEYEFDTEGVKKTFTFMNRKAPYGTVYALEVLETVLISAAFEQNVSVVFIDDGNIPAHNNLSELLIRQPVVGRKNWLFAGSEGGAQTAATWFSLIGSCMVNAIDPWLYLSDVLPQLNAWPANRVLELEPAAWRARRLSQRA